MKYWATLGLLLVLFAGVQLVGLHETRAASTPAATWMIGFGAELDQYALRHEGRYPPSLDDLVLDGRSPHAAHADDPWGQAYIYERHPGDARMCRVYTLGDPRKADRRDNDSTVAYYRLGSLAVWRARLEDVPAPWRQAERPTGLARQP